MQDAAAVGKQAPAWTGALVQSGGQPDRSDCSELMRVFMIGWRGICVHSSREGLRIVAQPPLRLSVVIRDPG